jgi:cell division protein FtsL
VVIKNTKISKIEKIIWASSAVVWIVLAIIASILGG